MKRNGLAIPGLDLGQVTFFISADFFFGVRISVFFSGSEFSGPLTVMNLLLLFLVDLQTFH